MVPWSIVATVISAAAVLVGGLIVINLKAIKKCLGTLVSRADRQDDRIAAAEQGFAACKIDCSRTTVSKEDWVRSEGYTRRRLDDVNATLNRMDGKLGVAERLPEICGRIASEVIKQTKEAD